jgi:hypothetical protein
MKNKLYIITSIIITIILLGVIFSFNYTIDPLRIKKDITTRAQKYNDLMKYRPDTIMLGGSRVQFLSTKDVKYYTNDTVYNISMRNMTLYEQLKYTEFALKQFNIKTIIIGLNFYTFSNHAKLHEVDFDENLLTQGVTLKYIKDIIQSYLTLAITFDAIDIYLNKEKYIQNRMFDKYGSRTLFMQNKLIGKKSWKLRSIKTNKSYIKDFSNFIISNKKISYYKKIIKLCKENGVDIKVFTTPMHSSLYKVAIKYGTLKTIDKWKKDLSYIYTYYDFMNINSITNNSDNYIDSSHVKQEFGKMIFKRMFSDDVYGIPKEFGILIKKKEIK